MISLSRASAESEWLLTYPVIRELDTTEKTRPHKTGHEWAGPVSLWV